VLWNRLGGFLYFSTAQVADLDRNLSWPQPSKPIAAPALSLARLFVRHLAGRSDWRRLHLELAEQLDLLAKTCSRFRRLAKESLQSLADLLGDSPSVGMVNVNSVAHGNLDAGWFQARKFCGPRPPPLAIRASARFEQRVRNQGPLAIRDMRRVLTAGDGLASRIRRAAFGSEGRRRRAEL
jgi:hypothetical protein